MTLPVVFPLLSKPNWVMLQKNICVKMYSPDWCLLQISNFGPAASLLKQMFFKQMAPPSLIQHSDDELQFITLEER